MTLTTPSFRSPFSPVPISMPDTVLSKHDAGALLKKRREERGLTQEQVVEGTTVPNGGYLSNLEAGNVNPARSKHFPSLVIFLGLSEQDVRAINPAAVFEVAPPADSPAPRRFSAGNRGWKVPRQAPPPISESLRQAAEQYGQQAAFAGLREYRWQRFMQDSPFKRQPQTPEEWLAVYLDMRDRFNPPEPEE